MHCVHCGYSIQEGDVFCEGCGRKIEAHQYTTCIHCGQQITETDVFCESCGKKVGDTGGSLMDPQLPLPASANAEESFSSIACPKCGKVSSADDKFCVGCGSIISAVTAVEDIQLQSTDKQTEEIAPSLAAKAPLAAEPTPTMQPTLPAESPLSAEPPRAAESPRAAEPPGKPKNTKKIVIISVAALAIAAVLLLFVIPQFMTSQNDYNAEQEASENGDNLEAAYTEANTLIAQGDYEAAIEILESLGNYSDAEDLLKEAKYHFARQLIALGDQQAAIDILIMLGGYQDAAELVEELSRPQTPVFEFTSTTYRDVGHTFLLFYRSYISALNQQNANLLAHCSEACKVSLRDRFSINQNAVFKNILIEIDKSNINQYYDPDFDLYNGIDTPTVTFAVRCENYMWRRDTNAYEGENVAVWRATARYQTERGGWFVDRAERVPDSENILRGPLEKISYVGTTSPEGMALINNIWPKLSGYWYGEDVQPFFVFFGYSSDDDYVDSNGEYINYISGFETEPSPGGYAINMVEIAKNVYTITFRVPEYTEEISLWGAYDEYFYDETIDISNIEAGRIKYLGWRGTWLNLQYNETFEEAHEAFLKSLGL